MSAPDPLVLDEYGEAPIELSHGDAVALQVVARDRLSVLPGSTPALWRVKASSWVGTVVTPAIRVLVRPKVFEANLFYMLEPDGNPLSLGPEVFEYETTGDLVPSFATFYARQVEAALSRGVVRAYREEEDQLLGVRGRIDLAGQRRSAGLPLPLSCRFDEYTADTPLNRILLAAAIRLARLPGVAHRTRAILHSTADRLAEAGRLTQRDLRTKTEFTRLNEHFKSAERLARIVIGGSSLTDAVGAADASVFMVNMNSLFESFVETRLRRYLAGQLSVIGQRVDHLGLAKQVAIQPDLTFADFARRIVYVADAKYKLTRDGYARQADYYQLLAYATALKLSRGLLIYCQDDGDAPARTVQVRHHGPQLATWAVRLDGPPAAVDAQLRAVAAHVAEAAGPERSTRSAVA